MSAQSVDTETIKALATMAADDLGESEEDVKVRFVVPLLHALGHTKLRFEHKGIDVLLKTGLPRGCAVVVETKRPDASLDPHLEQLERYSFEARSLLSVLTNGRVLRIYAPFWNRATTFAETLLWEFRRGDLAQFRHIEAIAGVLSRDALAAKTARAAIEHRQGTIEFIWEVAEEIRQRHRDWGEQLRHRVDEIGRQMAALDLEQRRCEEELRGLDAQIRDKLRRLFKLAGIPLVPTGDYWDLAAEDAAAAEAASRRKGAKPRRKPQARGWTVEDVRAKATPIQVRIFSAFVQLGKRTLGLKEIARHARLAPKVISGAMASFRTRKELTGREPPDGVPQAVLPRPPRARQPLLHHPPPLAPRPPRLRRPRSPRQEAAEEDHPQAAEEGMTEDTGHKTEGRGQRTEVRRRRGPRLARGGRLRRDDRGP